MIRELRLHTEGHDIVVSIKRGAEWHEAIRTHGALDHVTVDHCVNLDCIPSRGYEETQLTGKHRERILDTIRELADWLDPDRIPSRPSHREQTTTLPLVAILGLRNPETDDVTLMVRVSDPHEVLRKGYGCIEGMSQLGFSEFAFDREQVAEHLSTLLANDAIAIAKRAATSTPTDTLTADALGVSSNEEP
jgi:hypothetical protein